MLDHLRRRYVLEIAPNHLTRRPIYVLSAHSIWKPLHFVAFALAQAQPSVLYLLYSLVIGTVWLLLICCAHRSVDDGWVCVCWPLSLDQWLNGCNPG